MRKTLALFLYALALTSACEDKEPKASGYLDKSSLTAEAEAAIQPWLEHAPEANGFFRTRFNRYWQPQDRNDRVSLVKQARLLYVLAVGYDLSGDALFIDAVQAGGQFLLTEMRNPANGGWYRIVDRQGQSIRAGVHTYGYSFVIFGLSHAYRVTGDKAFLNAALETWRSSVWPGLNAARHLADSGSVGMGTGANIDGKAWSQNPYMHLFEALLVAAQEPGGGPKLIL